MIDLTDADWHKSSYSNGGNGGCVEVASNLPGVTLIRDSTRPSDGALEVTPAAFGNFLDDLKAGKYSPDA
jgi:hypothetical protein